MTYPRTATLEEQLYKRLGDIGYIPPTAASRELANITAWLQTAIPPASLAKSLVKAIHSVVDVPYSLELNSRFSLSSRTISLQATRLATHLLTFNHPLLADQLASYYSNHLCDAFGWGHRDMLALLRQPALRTHPKMVVTLKKARTPTRRRASSATPNSSMYDQELILSLLIDPYQWVALYTRYSHTLSPSLRQVFTSDLTHEHFAAIELLQWPDVLLDPQLCDWVQKGGYDIPPLPNQALARIAAHGSPILRSWVFKNLASGPSAGSHTALR